jgi:hypothetical protein
MLKVVSDWRPLVYEFTPFILSKLVDQSSSVLKSLLIPLIWTNADTSCPLALVIVHSGPDGCHPDRPEPGVSHLFAESFV